MSAVAYLRGLLAACLAPMLWPFPALALSVEHPSIPEYVASSHAVVVGRVTAIEERPVTARPTPDYPEKVKYLIAVVKIEEALTGAKGLTHIKIGFRPPEPGYSDGRALYVGSEALFFVRQHPHGPFLIVAVQVNKLDAIHFGLVYAQASGCASLLADPEAGLTSSDPDARYLTAAMLVARYCPFEDFAPWTPDREPIDARQSQLILHALWEADWTRQEPRRLTPGWVFYHLGLTAEDGWVKPSSDAKEFADAAKQWLKDHADTYRIKRFVPEK
jgi:hypothetical protein